MLLVAVAAGLALAACSGSSGSRGRSLLITTDSLPDAQVGTPYSVTLEAVNGRQPYTWGLQAGTLPNGLVLDPTGVISGTPTVPGAFPLTVEVTDSATTPASATAQLTLTVLGTGVPPDATLCTILGTRRGMVDLCYDLADADGDLVTITVEYSSDSGATFQAATSGPGGEGSGPILAQPTASRHLYVWDSGSDLGAALVDPVRLRLTPVDSLQGTPRETSDFIVDNRPGASVFLPSSPMQVARMDHTATLLSNGEVLVVGGSGTGNSVLDSGETFSPVTGEFELLLSTMATPRTKHTATLLPDGTVLIAGGISSPSGPELDSAEIYDPSTRSFQPTGVMAGARQFHAATVAGGVAYVTGGYELSGPTVLDGMEEYDAPGGSFSPVTGTFREARAGHGAHALSNGRILLVAGSEIQSTLSAEEFDPATGTSPVFEVLASSVETLDHATTMMQDGTVLVTGGGPSWGWVSIANAYDQANIWTPGAGFTTVAPMQTARRHHTSTQVPDGRVLVAGGEENLTFRIMQDSEVYDPVGQSFALTDTMTIPRMRHAAVLLDDGRVLITGGQSSGPDPVDDTERYHP